MYKADSMISPSIVDLLGHVENKYSLVIATSKRARNLIEGDSAVIELESSKPLTLAINEIHENKMEIEESEDEDE